MAAEKEVSIFFEDVVDDRFPMPHWMDDLVLIPTWMALIGFSGILLHLLLLLLLLRRRNSNSRHNVGGRMVRGFQGHIEGGSGSGKFDQYAIYKHENFKG